MPHAELIIHNAGQLVTCASWGHAKRGSEMLGVGIIENGAVAVVDGKIAAVDTSDKIVSGFDASDYVDAGGRVVCPGFVDPHTHIVYAGDRLNEFELKIKGADYLDILAAGGGIISTVRNTRNSTIGELVELGRARLDKMLRCGTTTCEIKTGYGLDVESELKMLRVIDELDQTHPINIVPTLLAAHAVPPEFRDDPDEYVGVICSEILPLAWQWYTSSHFGKEGTPFFCDVFTERNAFTVEQSARLFAAAKEMGFGIKAHVGQFTDLGGSGMAIGRGATSIDHLDHISEDEVRLLAGSDAVGVVIPTENFNAGKTAFADARGLINAGCAVALSTDYNPGSAPCPSMPMAMAIACRYQKLSPAEVLNAATINAAWAIGLGASKGSIETAKDADILLLECDDYRQLPYEFGGNLVSSVLIGGKVVGSEALLNGLC